MLNCGLVRDRGIARTSATSCAPEPCNRATKSTIDLVEWPIVRKAGIDWTLGGQRTAPVISSVRRNIAPFSPDGANLERGPKAVGKGLSCQPYSIGSASSTWLWLAAPSPRLRLVPCLQLLRIRRRH